MIRHVVLMTFKDETTPQDVQTVHDALHDFASRIDYVVSFEHGPNLYLGTPSPKASYAVVVDFETAEDCLRYEDEPEHDVVRNAVLPLVAGVVAADFQL